MEHDRDAGVLGAGPHAVEADVARGVPRRTPGRDQQRGGTHPDRLVGHRGSVVEGAQRHVARGKEARVGRAELDHPAVVRAGGAQRELDIAGVLPVAQAAVVERVEHELAGEAEEVDRAAAVFGEERACRGEVLAVHDLGCFVGGVLARPVPVGQAIERRIEVAELLVGVARLAELVASPRSEALRCGRESRHLRAPPASPVSP